MYLYIAQELDLKVGMSRKLLLVMGHSFTNISGAPSYIYLILLIVSSRDKCLSKELLGYNSEAAQFC